MLAEFLDRIVGLAKGAHRFEFQTHESLPRKVFVRNGETITEQLVPPPEREHGLVGFADFVRAVSDKDIAPAPVVFADGARVVALLDGDDRRETVEVDLQASRRFLLCQGLEANALTLKARQAVKFLRYDLHGGNIDHVIQALCRVDFTRTSAGKSHVDHGRESLGKSVEAAVQQAENVPKEFVLAIPIWTNPGFDRYTANITFGLDFDLEAEAVVLRVLSDECTRVQNLAVRAAIADLQEALPDGTPIFQGTP